MAQMASGAQYIKGSFTVPNSGSSYTLNFGKTFAKYLFIIEATDESKATMISSTTVSAAKLYCLVGSFPSPGINNTPGVGKLANRYTPSTEALGSVGTKYNTCGESSIVFTVAPFETGGANYLYNEFSYNYYIVEIK